MAKKVKILDSRTGYDLAACDYDKKEAYLNSFEKGKLIPLLGDLVGKRVLDAGAGTGRLSLELAKAGAAVTALDISPAMLKSLRQKSKKEIEMVAGDVESMPFADESFDVVVAAFLIVHLKDPRRFFDEVYRVLKDDGVFLVTNINQKESPEVETKTGKIKIESYYHRPDKIRELLSGLAFGVEQEEIVRVGENWINQIVLAKK